MGTKIIHLDEYFPTGELTVQPVLLWANGKPCYEGISKYASAGEEFFRSIQPVPGHSFVYVLALGSWESYGENRNGDAFPEFPYMENADPPWITDKDTLVNNYKTFEQFGYNYRHHVNKDPKKSVGRVHTAFWNGSMHRVELLVDLEDAKAPDLAERIAAGEYPPVSMGTRVPKDICSICGNPAPTRKHYCDHLKYQMKDVIEGKKVCALNPSPKFFDISWVFKPADRTAFMLKKVAEDTCYELSGAEAGEYIERIAADKSAANKLAVIDKIVQGLPVDSKTCDIPESELNQLQQMRSMVLDAAKNTPDLPDNILKQLADKPLPSVLSTAASSGMIQLSTPEITKIIIYKSKPNIKLSSDVLDRTVALQQGVFDLLSEHPSIMDDLKKTGSLSISPDYIDNDISLLLEPYIEKRSGISQYLQRRFVPDPYRNEAARTTPLSLTDPSSGQQYQTTTGAAIKSHDEIAKRNLYKMLGGAALLGGAYKLITTGLKGKVPYIKPIAAGTLGTLGYLNKPTMGQHYMTDQGVPVPVTTELAKVSSFGNVAKSTALPLLGTLGVMAGLGHDYQSRIKSPVPIGYEGLPLSRQIINHAGEFTHNYPVLSGVLGTALGVYGGRSRTGKFLSKHLGNTNRAIRTKAIPKARDLVTSFGEGVKMSSYVEDFVNTNTSTVELPSIDLEKLSEWLGRIIIEG